MNRHWKWLTMLALWLLAMVAHAGTHHHYYTDPQGTVLAKTDAQGNVIATYDYAPYGQAVASMSGAPDGPGYTGHVNDPGTGLVYMQARYYDPGVGRFLSVDPAEKPPINGLFVTNRYTYAANNPNRYVDPDGRQEIFASDPVLMRAMVRPSPLAEAIRQGIRSPVPRTAAERAADLARESGIKPRTSPAQWKTETREPWTPPDVMKGQFDHWDDAPDFFRLMYHLIRVFAVGHPSVTVGAPLPHPAVTVGEPIPDNSDPNQSPINDPKNNNPTSPSQDGDPQIIDNEVDCTVTLCA